MSPLEVLIQWYLFIGLLCYLVLWFGNFHKEIDYLKLISFSIFWLPVSIYFTVQILRDK